MLFITYLAHSGPPAGWYQSDTGKLHQYRQSPSDTGQMDTLMTKIIKLQLIVC